MTAQIPQSIARMLAEYLSDIIDVRTFSSVDDATTWLGVCVASPEGGGIGE